MLRFPYSDTTIGADFPEAIARVESAELPSLAGPLKVVFGVYANMDAALSGKAPLNKVTIEINHPTLGFYVGAVQHLIETRAVTLDPMFRYAVIAEES